MLVKYIYIFDVIIFVTSLCSFIKNIKADKTWFNSIISILLGFFGVIITNFTYSILSSSFNEIWTLAILTVIEFIEILLLFKQKNLKSVMLSMCVPIIITFSILYANQLNMQNIFNYNIDNKINTAIINGFSKEYKESRLQIPRYIVKGLKFYKVTSINEKAFYECKDLYNVKLPNSIKNIGNLAFAECEMLYDINVPNNLETLGARAFYNTNLEGKIKLSDNIKCYDDLNNWLERDYRNYNYDISDNTIGKYYYFKEGLCLTQLGYIDKTGNIVINTDNYIPVSDFSEGLACVCKNQKYGYINTNGDVIIDFKYDKAYDFSEGLACVEENGTFGYIDTKGNVIIDFQYEDPSIRGGEYICKKDFGLFIDGIACVKKDGKFGYINKNGNVLIDCKFYWALPFYNEIAFTSDGYIDKNGNNIVDFAGWNSFSSGLARVIEDEKYGYINTNGDVIIDFEYDRAFNFSEGLACVEKNGKFGYIDTKGNVIIDFQYDRASNFSEGLACAEKNGKFGYIDIKGNVVIDFQYDRAFNFSEGLALVKKDNKYLFINKKGEIVIDKVEVNELIFSGDSIFLN